MKIGNIIYDTELVNHTKVDYINYINKFVDYDSLDKTLPTLYVGWSFMKECNPNDEIIQNTNILYNKIIGNELYWECSFSEGKSSHIRGVENFSNSVPIYYFSPKYLYVNLDPVFFQIKDIDDLMDVLPNNIDAIYIHKNQMAYILTNNKVSGINLASYSFFKFNIDELILKISERTKEVHIDLDGETYQKYYKIFPNFNQLKRYMVVLLTKYV